MGLGLSPPGIAYFYGYAGWRILGSEEMVKTKTTYTYRCCECGLEFEISGLAHLLGPYTIKREEDGLRWVLSRDCPRCSRTTGAEFVRKSVTPKPGERS